MASKKSIYISDAAEKVIGDNENVSGRINSIIVRYGTIMEKDCPELTESEWMMICDILNGTDHRDADPARFLWADISESGKLDGMAEKWEIDTEALSQRVRDMEYTQQVAIIEIVHRFWRGNSNAGSYSEILKAVGAKVLQISKNEDK